MEQWSEAQRQPKYKAESLGKLAQHNNAQSSGDTVNDAVAQGKTATLIRGDLADEASDPVSTKFGDIQQKKFEINRLYLNNLNP